MSSQVQRREDRKKTGILNDPGNMLIIFYVAFVLFFLILGGLGASKYSSDTIHRPSSVMNEAHHYLSQTIKLS